LEERIPWRKICAGGTFSTGDFDDFTSGVDSILSGFCQVLPEDRFFPLFDFFHFLACVQFLQYLCHRRLPESFAFLGSCDRFNGDMLPQAVFYGNLRRPVYRPRIYSTKNSS
jgi:hypothetical protein